MVVFIKQHWAELGSMIISIISAFIAYYAATESARSRRKIDKQKFDLIARPFPKFREMPSAQFMIEIEQINYNPRPAPGTTWNYQLKENSMNYVFDDIGNGGVYYGLITKDNVDPISLRNMLIQMQYFDRIYVTKQGKRKHKRMHQMWKQVHTK